MQKIQNATQLQPSPALQIEADKWIPDLSDYFKTFEEISK